MTKRQKFVFNAIALSGAFFLIASSEAVNRLLSVSLLSIASTILLLWALSDTLRRDATLLVFILPALFTFGVGSFWFLLPAVAAAHIPIIVLYGIGMYALMLTANIISVSKVRTIALLRAAKSVSFVITLFTSFLLFDAIFSLKVNIIVNMLLTFGVSFFLFLPQLWVTKLSHTISKKVLGQCISYSYILSMLSGLIYFWPSSVVVSAILLTVATYIILGLAQANLEERLFKETMREYVFVGIIVLLVIIFSTSWRG